MGSESRRTNLFSVQRTNSRDLDRNAFTRVLNLEVDPQEANRRNRVKVDTTVQIHFTTAANLTLLQYSIDLRLSRLDREGSDQLTTVSLQRNFVPPSTGNQNSYTELMNLTWTDLLESRRARRRGLDSDDEIETSGGCRDNGDVRYAVSIRFNDPNGFFPINLEAQTRSLTAVVFPEGSRGFDFFL